jgi:hypothetical protein
VDDGVETVVGAAVLTGGSGVVATATVVGGALVPVDPPHAPATTETTDNQHSSRRVVATREP